jgi:hypothetical protein
MKKVKLTKACSMSSSRTWTYLKTFNTIENEGNDEFKIPKRSNN